MFLSRHSQLITLVMFASLFLFSACTSKERLNEELLTACAYGDLTKVKELIGKGADVNYRPKTGGRHYTAFLWAVYEQQYPTAELLLQHGADPTVGDVEGETAMDFALGDGSAEGKRFQERLKALGVKAKYVPVQEEGAITRLSH